MVFSAFELRVDVLMAMQLNGSEVEALLPPANATNVSASGALLISAILFRCAQGTAWPPCHRSSSNFLCGAFFLPHAYRDEIEAVWLPANATNASATGALAMGAISLCDQPLPEVYVDLLMAVLFLSKCVSTRQPPGSGRVLACTVSSVLVSARPRADLTNWYGDF